MTVNSDDDQQPLLTPTIPDQRKSAEYSARVEELGNLISPESLVGGKTFEELSLYEKKSVLINHELE